MQGSDKNKKDPTLDAALDVIESEVSGASESSSAVEAKEGDVLGNSAVSSASNTIEKHTPVDSDVIQAVNETNDMATDSEAKITVDDDWESLLDDSATLPEQAAPEQKNDTSRLDPDPIPSDDDLFGDIIDAPPPIDDPAVADGNSVAVEAPPPIDDPAVADGNSVAVEAPSELPDFTSVTDNADNLENHIEPIAAPRGLNEPVDLEDPAGLPVDFDAEDEATNTENSELSSDSLDFLDEPIKKSTEAEPSSVVADKVKAESSADVPLEEVRNETIVETPPETDVLDSFNNEEKPSVEKQPVLNDDLDELFGDIVESKTSDAPVVQKESSNDNTSNDDIMDAMLEDSDDDTDEITDPLSDWSDSPADDEDLLPDLFEPEQEPSNNNEESGDDDVSGIFASLDENSSSDNLGAEGKEDDLGDFESLLDKIEEQRGRSLILDESKKPEGSEPSTTKNDTIGHKGDESASHPKGVGEMTSEKPEVENIVQDDNSEVSSENKPPHAFGVGKIIGLGVFALSIGVISSIFIPKYLTPYLPASFSQQDETPEILATINRLESAIKELRTKFAAKNDGADANASANEKLMAMYQELASSQKALSDEQSHNTRLISTLSSELTTYENEMLTRFGQVLSLTKNAVESSAEQSQTIKEAVLREALATMKAQQDSEGAQTVAALQAKLLESNKRTAELESAVVAQRNIISLVESEVDYVKERMLDNAKKTQTPQPLNETRVQSDVQVFVDPKPKERTFANQTTVVKQDVPQRTKLHLVGVLRKKEGNYELYVQRSDAKGSTGILSYDYKPGHSVVIPGYGRILKVREDDDPKLRVNYVLEMEDGQIRGKP
jgi:hypothetical protein